MTRGVSEDFRLCSGGPKATAAAESESRAPVDYVWTARGDLDKGIQERITAAFLKLDYNNPEHRKLLDLHRTKKYIKADDADWKGTEEAAIAAGLLK